MGEIWGDMGRYGEIWGCIDEEMTEVAEIWGRYGEMWGDVGSCGEI